MANPPSHGRDGTRKSQAEAVENGFPSQRQHFFRNVLIFRIDDEFGNILRQPGYIRKLTGTFLPRQRRRCSDRERTCNELTPFHARSLLLARIMLNPRAEFQQISTSRNGVRRAWSVHIAGAERR